MAIPGHHLAAHRLDAAVGRVFQQAEAAAKLWMPRPGKDLLGISPDKVRDHACPRVDLAQTGAVEADRKHPRVPAARGLLPAVQEDGATAVGRHEQMVEPVLALAKATWKGHVEDVGKRHEHRDLTGFQIDPLHAHLGRSRLTCPRVGKPGVAVAGAELVDAAEVGRDRGAAIGREGVDGRRQRAGRPTGHLVHAGHVAFRLAIVVDHEPIAAGNPLQHAALLPAPGPRLAEANPAVTIGQIDHAHLDRVGGRRGAVLKPDRVAQAVPHLRIKLQLVVVGKPVVPRAAGDRSHRHFHRPGCPARAPQPTQHHRSRETARGLPS